MNITIKNEKGVLEKLKANNFSEEKPKTPFETHRLQKDCTVVFYKSGKILFQGSDMAVLQALSLIRGQKKTNPVIKTFDEFGNNDNNINLPKEIIGSDETLKGDTFGGLVVAAFKGNKEMRHRLMALGVRDSKLLSEIQIEKIAQKLIELFPSRISVVNLSPEEYNNKLEFITVTALLNDLHQEVGKRLRPGFHVVDHYPGCKVGDESIERAESKYLEVAAASIIARYYGLKQFVNLSTSAGFELPRGSTHVKEAVKKIREKGFELEKFVKLHFRNVLK